MHKIVVLSGNILREFDIWNSYVKDYFDDEPMLKPNYVRLFCEIGEEYYAVVLKIDDNVILYPFIRKIIANSDGYYDAMSAYGYGGPRIKGNINIDVINEFWKYVTDLFLELKIVTEIVKFSLFENTKIYPGKIEFSLNNIVRNLEFDDDKLWMDFEHKVRKNISRAEKYSLEFYIDEKNYYIEDFIKIYYSTLDRNSAQKKYYFDTNFFIQINNSIVENVKYFFVKYKDIFVSTELILISKCNAYSYLGGTLKEYYEMRPNDFLKFNIIKWCKNIGLKNFVLGGGHSDNDGIYRYKKSFSPGGTFPFYVGTRIINPLVYIEICKNSNKNPDDSFIPAYRS